MRRLRTTWMVSAVIATGAWLTLGFAWWRDRHREWETPGWNPARFTRVEVAASAAPAPTSAAAETWVIAVNLHCPHCLARLDALAGECAQDGDCPPLLALVVDAPRMPRPQEVGSLPVAQVWWDARGVWRNRWGHRVYGEVMRFDSAGRYRGPLATVETPEHALESSLESSDEPREGGDER